MATGSRRRRRIALAALTAGLLATAGCRWLPLQRRGLAEPRANPVESRPETPPAQGTPTATGRLTPPVLHPVEDAEALATPPGSTSTPILDEAYARAQAEVEVSQPPPVEPAPAPAETPQGPDEPEHAPRDHEVQRVSQEPVAPVEPRVDSASVPDAPSTPEPDPAVAWRRGIESLLGLAREQAAREAESGNPGTWWAREQFLARLAEADDSFWAELIAAASGTAPVELAPATEANAAPVAPEPTPVASVPPVRPPLAIVAPSLCRKVEGFGLFEPATAGEVKPGASLILYWEVEGLEARRDGDLHRTRLSTTIELVPEGSEAVAWSQRLGEAEDACRRPRRDYFVNARIAIPANLAPGPYRLRLVLDDLNARVQARAELPVVIATP